jgi:hypothetical protein
VLFLLPGSHPETRLELTLSCALRFGLDGGPPFHARQYRASFGRRCIVRCLIPYLSCSVCTFLGQLLAELPFLNNSFLTFGCYAYPQCLDEG